MKKTFFVFLFLNATAVVAEPRPQVTVWTRGHIRSAKAILPKEYKVLDRKTEAEDLRAAGYLEPAQREALFRKVGIDSKLKKLDELDKDMLVMGVPHYSVAELIVQYPMLNETQIRALKREIGNVK